MPTTYTLIPGAGGSAWEWHRISPLLSDRGGNAIAVDLPVDDDAADLTTYADTVYDEVADASLDRSFLSLSRWARSPHRLWPSDVPAALIILVNPMVPAPGEAVGNGGTPPGRSRP